MELAVDLTRKNILQKHIAGSLKGVRVITKLAKILMFIGVFGSGAYALLNFLIPSWSLAEVQGVMQKDTSWIIISTSFISAPTLILAACLKALAGNLAGINNSARVDESMNVTSGNIRYAYREKYQSRPDERRIITIEFDRINSVIFDYDTNLIRFSGKIRSEYFDSYKKKKPVDTRMLDEFTICDYFSPSLKEVLLNKKIHIDS